MAKIIQAAFRSSDNQVVGTGSCHNTDQLPPDFEIESEGFLCEDGSYETREEATQELHSGCPIRSADLELSKSSKDYKILPPEENGPDLIIRTQHIPSGKNVGELKISGKPSSLPGSKHTGYHLIRSADVNIRHQHQGIYGSMLRAAANHVKQKGAKGIASEGHWRSDAATGAWKKLKAKSVPGLEGASDFRLNEEGLSKDQPPPGFPKLGLENRRETPIVSGPKEAETKYKLMINAIKLKQKKAGLIPSIPSSEIAPGKKIGPGRTVGGMTIPGGTTANIAYASGMDPRATKLHEDIHMLLNRVHSKHGHRGALNLAFNLFQSIPPENQKTMKEYVSHIYGNKEPPATKYHEEHLGHLIGFLNSETFRNNFHKMHPGHWDKATNQPTEKARKFQTSMKQAYRHLSNAAAIADENWVKRPFRQSEIKKLHKSQEWDPTHEEHMGALNSLNAFHSLSDEFKAAKFMANDYSPTQEEIDEALAVYEDDYEAIALAAYHLPITQENIDLLRKIVLTQQGELSKAEFEVSAIPRIVEPFNKDGKELADVVRDAFEHNAVHGVRLGGKHSAGAAILRDEEDGKLWLLKPGANKMSPALGAREERASQSRREIAFNQVARLMGLGNYVPEAQLLILDSKEVAALEFFPSDFKPLDEWKRHTDVKLDEIFAKFVPNGLLHKWAAMDFILGQTDRHSNNILLDDGHNVKFIDAGSALAGPSFNPAIDPKSFVPVYLRLFTHKKFKVLTPQERFNVMPKLTDEADEHLGHWLNSLDTEKIVEILNAYGINPQPTIDRLNRARQYSGPKWKFFNSFFAGLDTNLT